MYRGMDYGHEGERNGSKWWEDLAGFNKLILLHISNKNTVLNALTAPAVPGDHLEATAWVHLSTCYKKYVDKLNRWYIGLSFQ